MSSSNEPHSDEYPGGTEGFKEGDPVSDWRIINKKAESDQKEWEDAMKKNKEKGLPEIPFSDWLGLQKPQVP